MLKVISYILLVAFRQVTRMIVKVINTQIRLGSPIRILTVYLNCHGLPLSRLRNPKSKLHKNLSNKRAIIEPYNQNPNILVIKKMIVLIAAS